MKRLTLLLIIPLLLHTSWGFFAHRTLIYYAVFALPQEMLFFYKKEIAYLKLHAVDADKRRYVNENEAARHYIDLERFNKPDAIIPMSWQDALTRYGDSSLQDYGILPWQINKSYYALVAAFKNRNAIQILKQSCDLAHYVADAYVPLHTTENHNGQLSNQWGIHAFWESLLPERFSTSYQFVLGRAQYIENPQQKAWDIVLESHALVQALLHTEAQLSAEFTPDLKYEFRLRNRVIIRQYASNYALHYHQRLNNMVEQQMQKASYGIACFWYSAWVDAGQPELKNIDKAMPPEDQEDIDLEQQYLKGQLKGREI